MDKHIEGLLRDPFRVVLADRACSIFVDPMGGTILVDEGEGEGRLNGAVMYSDRGPTFSLATEGNIRDVLLLDYCGFRLVVGKVKDLVETQDWVTSVNRFLASKMTLAALPTAVFTCLVLPK